MSFERRIIVVGLVWNKKGELLLCKMPPNRGVFPGQWGLPGGGIKPNETMEEALRREMKEEIGIEIENIEPVFFKDGEFEKTFADSSKRKVYMIFLLFNCRASEDQLQLSEEFEEYRWISLEDAGTLDLNVETVKTLQQIAEIR
ncbi:MAG: nucleoside triphosphatase NudI [Pyrinomonadaceae bacterium]|nr:nucleoside triphosphatase NudI [Pyrinomonadaceae bacterium]